MKRLLHIPFTLLFCLIASAKAGDHSLHLGATLNDGNSDSQLYTAGFESTRDLANGWATETDLSYQYGESNNETSSDQISANLKAKKDFSPTSYGLLLGSFFKDELANIDRRVSVGPGYGAQWIETDATTLNVEFGPVWLHEDNGDEQDNSVAIRIAQELNHALSETAKIWQKLEYVGDADDSENYFLTATLGAESSLNAKLSMRVELVNRYDNTPSADKTENDLSIIAGVSYKL